MQEKKTTILYFIDGPMPTPEDLEIAAQVGTSRFRNVERYVPGECLEAADAVAGQAPEAYLKAYPRADGKILAKLEAAKAKAAEDAAKAEAVRVKAEEEAAAKAAKAQTPPPPPPPPPAAK